MFPIQFQNVPYPLWRRRGLEALRPLLRALYPVDEDDAPPASPAQMADYLTRHGILPEGMNSVTARDALAALENEGSPSVIVADMNAMPAEASAGKVRLPAQWEPMEAVIVRWPVLYPSLWTAHAQMVEGISPVARVDVLLPADEWAAAVFLFLERRGLAQLHNVRFLLLPTDDIWVRDYGPFIAYDDAGERVVVSAKYDPLPYYPQAQDDAMATRYAAYLEVPTRRLDLHTEGGNFWSDGIGTLLVSEGLFSRNPTLERDEVLARLSEIFIYQKLIVTPSLWREETGHIDLLVKLADARTVLVSAPTLAFNRSRLRETAETLRRTTNAASEPYRVVELPVPQPYLNWGVFPIWRSYTNALTINGRVLVPIFGVGTDGESLAIYRATLPDYEIIPIMCNNAANGGGAVHCLTKEVAV